MKRDKIYYFEQAPISTAIANFALPMIFSMTITIIYNLVDTFYIGLLGSHTLVASLSLSMPVFFVFMGIGNIFGIGGSTYISRLLGGKDKRGVRKTSAFVFYASIISGLLLSLICLIFIEPLLILLGVSKETINPTRSYTVIMLAGGVFKVLSFSLMQIIRSEGSPKEAMFGNIMGTILNIILDPIFLFVMNWGISGVAAATLISEIFSSLYYILFIWKKSTFLSLKFSDFMLKIKVEREIYKIGFPTFLQSIVIIIMNLAQNNVAASFSDVYVAVFAIVFKLSLIPILLCRGLCFGIQPLIAYNYAAKNFPRMFAVLKSAFIYGNFACGIFFIFALGCSRFLLNLFSHNSQIVFLGEPVLKIGAISFLTYPLSFLTTSVFQSTGRGKPSLIMSLAQGIFFIPLVYFAGHVGEIINFVWALPVSNILSALLGSVIYMYYRKKYMTNI